MVWWAVECQRGSFVMFVRLVSVRVSAAPIIFEGCRRRSGQSCAEDVPEGVAGGVCVSQMIGGAGW